MPRPRKNPNEVLVRELRITPPDNEPITDWRIDETITKLVAFEEGGGDTGKKLHYHAYIETTMTSQALPKWIYAIARCIETGERGNAVFFTRKPHDATLGYIAKCRKVAIRHGETQSRIEEWFKQSDEYTRQRASARKREQRIRSDELREVIDQVKNDLHADVNLRSVNNVVHAILRTCKHNEVRFPTRTQMETFVVELLYPYDDNLIARYYTRSFPDFSF